ncbi:aldehyde dehydrogenase (NADP(+)) [Allomuricauda sp. SCSIO 65647]|uniref:aldehyde dehydrogenase (NADP(+)) n=1 Tax=Allomuricauda sp. SCSIO 65647 TaxID=2908843 RepID=UPI001F40DEEA|nr:aldehyde dehydrogenase (NADP(+)) [Muricauda sp. SCSIO 65647]UJH69237.1 aldehyde dehydrogenase (NADP(+)) [Muricauda sp. SCSIO 65647]
MITGKNYVGNNLSAKGSKTYKTFNPKLNLENQHVFVEASEDEIDGAVALAQKAFETYRNVPGPKKAAFIRAIADNILDLGDDLIETYCFETGLPKGRAEGERGRTIFQLRSFADLVEGGSWVEAAIDTALPSRTPVPKPDLRKMNIPIGPIVVFGASNFPLAFSTAGGDTASALAAGCPVVVKSHPMHAGTGELVASAIVKAVEETGMPNGVFSNLNSSGIEVGKRLVQHTGVKGVGFTGSTRGGRALYDLAAKREEPIPVFAEMGSINPVVVLPDAMRKKADRWAEAYAGAITLGSGQFCTNPGLLLGIKGDALANFIKQLGNAIVKMEPSCMLHPNIVEAYESGKSQAMAQPESTLVVDYDGEAGANHARQAIITVEGKAFLENPTLHHEVFGPFSMVVQCNDASQMEGILSKLEGQLVGTVIAEGGEAKNYHGVVEALKNRVGRLVFNGVPTGVEVCPSMTHGGPYPASTDSRFTAVGIDAIKRWVRPVSYQDWPDELLPVELQNENPLGIHRLINGEWSIIKI